MWQIIDLGRAVWESNGSRWAIDARGGEVGIGVLNTADSENLFDAATRFVSFSPVDEPTLPVAAEQYVNGNRWCINYPQNEHAFAVRLALEPVLSEQDLLVLEATVSVQTDLLDSHPKIDVDVPCREIDVIVPSDESGDDEVDGPGSAPINLGISDQHFVGVLLGPRDRPFTTNHSTDALLRLRLFGDFLEKGVIRKAQPWIVIDRSKRLSQNSFHPPSGRVARNERGGHSKRLPENPPPRPLPRPTLPQAGECSETLSETTPDRERLIQWWRQLCHRPLPLTP